MPKTAEQWAAKPNFPQTHYVDSRIYSDQTIFEEEREKLFKPSWIIACHESELAGASTTASSTTPPGCR